MAEFEVTFQCNGCGKLFPRESLVILHSQLCGDQPEWLIADTDGRPIKIPFIIQEPP